MLSFNMKIEIKCVILVLLASVSVRAITHIVRAESSRTVEKQKAEIRWNKDMQDNEGFKGQREIATVSPTTTSAVELVDTKETAPEKTPNPIIVAYFVANLGEKNKKTVYGGFPVQKPRGLGYSDYAKGYGSYGIQYALGVNDHPALNKPYTGYQRAPVSGSGSGYGYGYGGYGYSTQGSYGYPILGKFARKLRRIKDHLHFWRGFTKRLL